MPIDLDDEDAFIANLGKGKNDVTDKSIEEGFEDESVPSFSIKKRKLVEEVPEPVPYEKPKLTKRLCTVDLETDPFLRGRFPKPFSAGFAIDDDGYWDFWGDDCVPQFFAKLLERREYYKDLGEELVVYAHNGGKFDFNYFMDYIDEDTKPFFIDRRMVKINFLGVEFRDSYSILPVPLKKLKSKKWQKLDIDINLLEPLLREAHKSEILEYLRADCMTLLDAVRDFIERFGWKLTVASVALPMLQSYHAISNMNAEQDEKIRPYFKGGRVQCFQTGLIKRPMKMVDANSMYAGAMRNVAHPVSAWVRYYKDLDDPHVAFVDLTASSRGCLGIGGGLNFDFGHRKGRFQATIHEVRAGLDTGTLDIHRIHSLIGFEHWSKFDTFVDTFYSMRDIAKENKDELGDVFYKMIPNSSYGKLAMNTKDYKDYSVNPPSHPLPRYGKRTLFELLPDEDGVVRNTCVQSPQGWQPDFFSDTLKVYSRPTRNAGQYFLNVGTAASITGAARANLWRNICASTGVAYCDTDSIMCETFNGDQDNKRLGAWKLEAEGDAVCIGGKKMYAFLSTSRPNDYDKDKHEIVEIDGVAYFLLKKAHKGVQLRASQILDVCRGEYVEHLSDAPTFKDMGTRTVYQSRRIKMTAGDNSVEQFEMDF